MSRPGLEVSDPASCISVCIVRGTNVIPYFHLMCSTRILPVHMSVSNPSLCGPARRSSRISASCAASSRRGGPSLLASCSLSSPPGPEQPVAYGLVRAAKIVGDLAHLVAPLPGRERQPPAPGFYVPFCLVWYLEFEHACVWKEFVSLW